MFIPWHRFKGLDRIYDVRSARCYALSHIPGSVSLPVEIDLRAIKSFSSFPSSRQIRSYTKNWPEVLKEFAQNKGQPFGLYCQKGGLRSTVISKLLAQDYQYYFLEGGFESYVRVFESVFARPYCFIRICGKTGTGKSDVLNQLCRSGAQVLDLEGLSRHRGSVFGGSLANQPGQWQFEQQLSEELKKFDLSFPVFVEQKTSGIGSLHLPELLAKRVADADSIILEAPRKTRLNRLVKIYGRQSTDALAHGIDVITPRLGEVSAFRAKKYLQEGNLHACADILLDYYDGSRGYTLHSGRRMVMNSSDIERVADMLMSHFVVGKEGVKM